MDGKIIDISVLNKADVFKALYNYSRPISTQLPEYVPGDIDHDQAQAFIDRFEKHETSRIALLKTLYITSLRMPPTFDYLNGRPLRIRMDDKMDVSRYDEVLGEGSARKALIREGLISE